MTGSSKDDEPGSYCLYTSLKDVALENAEFFKQDTSSSGKRFFTSFTKINLLIDPVVELIREVAAAAVQFDFDTETPANGHRSFVLAMELIVKRTLQLSRVISTCRNSYFFRKNFYSREIEACSQVIESLKELIGHSQTLLRWCENGHLFPKEDHKPEEWLSSCSSYFVNQYPFYGRCIGFQFCEAIALIFKALSILMASFSEFYYSGGKVIDFLVNGSKYLIDPELRAKRIVNISQYASVDFCKAFWFLGEIELMQRLPSISYSYLVVNKVISINAEPLSVTSVKDGSEIEIAIPSAHKEPSSIPVRLLSSSYYFGMEDIPKKEGVKEASCGLVFHCHGGGFVAQSSRSHETYLRQWALAISAPIVSVDYSLAPETPYPRALEEVFYAYCWTLINAHRLGSTAQRIILAGDSAGANLNIGLTMKCIEKGVRPPDGLFLAYAPVVLDFVPSPSRLLCLMDPLLPFGFLMGCTKAYTCTSDVYIASKEHEHKLERNIAMKTFIVENGQTANLKRDTLSSEDVIVDEVNDDDATPVLMERKSSKTFYNFLSAIMSVLSSKFSLGTSHSEDVPQDLTRLEEEIRHEVFLPCPLNMLEINVPKDPYISPFYASDDVLRQFPPVSFLTVHFDPFLDDCIEFAKRLRSLGNPVTLDVLEGLSHGFLNFSMLCKEASDGSKICIKRINSLLFGDAVEA